MPSRTSLSLETDLIHRIAPEPDVAQVQQRRPDLPPRCPAIPVPALRKFGYAVGCVVGGTLDAVLLDEFVGGAVEDIEIGGHFSSLETVRLGHDY